MASVIQRVDLSDDYLVWLKTSFNEGTGKLLSLSPGGAYVATSMSLLPQAQVRLRILPPKEPYSFELEAVVNWENQGNQRRGPFPPGYGVRFTELGSSAVEAIREVLRSAIVPNIAAGTVDSSHWETMAAMDPSQTARFVVAKQKDAPRGSCPTCGK
ncbi:MAG TPA: PilZ domain-containing protein [Vicinamibacteria bacterium]|nr:PilZ domain-containing protein [Vicinamibacteria bacterium]